MLYRRFRVFGISEQERIRPPLYSPFPTSPTTLRRNQDHHGVVQVPGFSLIGRGSRSSSRAVRYGSHKIASLCRNFEVLCSNLTGKSGIPSCFLWPNQKYSGVVRVSSFDSSTRTPRNSSRVNGK